MKDIGVVGQTGSASSWRWVVGERKGDSKVLVEATTLILCWVPSMHNLILILTTIPGHSCKIVLLQRREMKLKWLNNILGSI